MTQYIDKAAVLTEIDRMIQKEYPCDNSEQEAGYDFALYELQDFLNTLEVKEVEKEPASKDLGEYINELSKQFPEVSFAKLSRIAVRAAKWQKEQTIEKACAFLETYPHMFMGMLRSDMIEDFKKYMEE